MFKTIIKSTWDYAVGTAAAALGNAVYDVSCYIYDGIRYYYWIKKQEKQEKENNWREAA